MLYVAESATRGRVSLPLAALVPLQLPEAVHEVAQGADHDSVGTLLAPIVAVKVTDGACAAEATAPAIIKQRKVISFFTVAPSLRLGVRVARTILDGDPFATVDLVAGNGESG